jgi:hypothetical protein
MSRSGLKGAAVAGAAVVLVALGAHLAWEYHRYSLRTSRGTVRVGMTSEEVTKAIGPAGPLLFVPGGEPGYSDWRSLDDGSVTVFYGNDGRVKHARFETAAGICTAIPRPSLYELVRSWLPRSEEEVIRDLLME